MQSSNQSNLNKNQSQHKNKSGRRRRRPRNTKNQAENKKEQEGILNKESILNLADLARYKKELLVSVFLIILFIKIKSESHALEKQLSELQKQLKINYSNFSNKEQSHMAKVAAIEQITATEEEIEYVRQRYNNNGMFLH
jgi:hypothetical protein